MIYAKDKQFELIREANGWKNLALIDNQYYEVCLEAVKNNGLAIAYVGIQTPELCLEAIKNNPLAIKDIKVQTPELCLYAVRNWGLVLPYIRKQTPEICLEAVKESGDAVKYVEEQTQEICLEAVKQNGKALEYVKDPTYEICLEAVKSNGMALEYVKNPTYELCLEAVINNLESIMYVKEPTKEFFLEIFKYWDAAITYIEEPTYEVCLEAVKSDGYSIEYINDIIENIVLDEDNKNKYVADEERMKKSILYLYAFLNKPHIYKADFIKKEVDYYINNYNLEKKLFFVYDEAYFYNEFYERKHEEYKNFINMVSRVTDNISNNKNLNDYELVKLEIECIDNKKDYLINHCKGNYFLIPNHIDIDNELIKSIALSNNKLIIIDDTDCGYDYEDIKDIYNTLANKILTEEELLQESF